mmetsp:Transcript_46171/g.100307  ORF Transcript_46171/g.100307 Transcript_46171/m.100307 type:complete len:192 (-) Transcript_46171:32-607(-)
MQLWLLWLLSIGADAARLQGRLQGSSVRARLAPEMPSQCSQCSATSDDSCSSVLGSCSCCRDVLKAEAQTACSGFLKFGKGDCVENIRAAIREKKENCKAKQAEEAATKAARHQVIEDVVGQDLFKLVAQSDASLYAPRRFNNACQTFQTASCNALCGATDGCNAQLALAEHILLLVSSWKELHEKLPCFR